jgi:hypothetical protein
MRHFGFELSFNCERGIGSTGLGFSTATGSLLSSGIGICEQGTANKLLQRTLRAITVFGSRSLTWPPTPLILVEGGNGVSSFCH